MNKPYIFRCGVWVLAFSILHLQFSSLAYGARDKESPAEISDGHSSLRASELFKGDEKENVRSEGVGEVFLGRPPEKPSEALREGYRQENLRGDTTPAGRLPPVRSEHPNGLEEPLFAQDFPHTPTLVLAEPDLEAAAYVQIVLANVLRGQNLDPNLGGTFSTLHRLLNPDEGIDPKTQTTIRITAALTAILASGAMALLFLTNGIVGGFLVPSVIGTRAPPFHVKVVVGAGCAGALSLIDNYLFLEEGLRNATHYLRSPHKAAAEDRHLGKSALLAAFSLPAVIGLGIETFVYVNTITTAPFGVVVFAIPAGVAYLTLRSSQAYSNTMTRWEIFWPYAVKTYQSLKSYFPHIFKSSQEEIPRGLSLNRGALKEDIRVHLAHGLRRVIADPKGVLALYASIQTLRQEINAARAEVKKVIETLPQNDKRAEGIYTHLQSQLKMYQWMEEMLIFQAYYNFDKDGNYPLGSGHPFLYRTAQWIGAVMGGMASGSVWYGMGYIFKTLGLSLVGTYASATATIFILTPYLMNACAKGFSGFISYVKGYNPIANSSTIEGNTFTSFQGARGAIAFANALRGVYLAFPASLLGLGGMAGLGPEAPRVGPEGLPTTASSMAAWGLVEHINTERPLQEKVPGVVQGIKKKISFVTSWAKGCLGKTRSKRVAREAEMSAQGTVFHDAEEKGQVPEKDFITRAHPEFGEGKEFTANVQQFIANQYGKIDGWVRSLNESQVILLNSYLRLPPEEWFTSEAASGGYVPPVEVGVER